MARQQEGILSAGLGAVLLTWTFVQPSNPNPCTGAQGTVDDPPVVPLYEALSR